MRREGIPVLSTIALVIVCAGGVAAQRAPGGPARPSEFDAFYSLGPDSLPRDGVPKGDVRGPFKLPSAAYPGAVGVIADPWGSSDPRCGASVRLRLP